MPLVTLRRLQHELYLENTSRLALQQQLQKCQNVVIFTRVLKSQVLHVGIDADETLLDDVQLLGLLGFNGPADEAVQAYRQS